MSNDPKSTTAVGKCTKCGNEPKDGDKYCRKCGQKL